MKSILIFLISFIICIFAYNFKCTNNTEYKAGKKVGEQGYNKALEEVEITRVHRCDSQHGKLIVRNLKGEVTEITLNEHYYPVSSTSSYTEIPVLDGHYKVRAIIRKDQNCTYREFNETILFTDTCEPYYVYVIKKADMVFQKETEDGK